MDLRWSGRCGSCFSQGQLFLNSSSDARLLRPILAAAAAGGEPPSREALDADAEALDVRPLFDGSELERI